MSVSTTGEKLLAWFLWNLVVGCNVGQRRTHYILKEIRATGQVHKLIFTFVNIARDIALALDEWMPYILSVQCFFSLPKVWLWKHISYTHIHIMRLIILKLKIYACMHIVVVLADVHIIDEQTDGLGRGLCSLNALLVNVIISIYKIIEAIQSI